MSKRPTTCPNGHPIDWGERAVPGQMHYGTCSKQSCPIIWDWDWTELWPHSSEPLTRDEAWYRATIRAERQAREAAQKALTETVPLGAMATAIETHREIIAKLESELAAERTSHEATAKDREYWQNQAGLIAMRFNDSLEAAPSPSEPSDADTLRTRVAALESAIQHMAHVPGLAGGSCVECCTTFPDHSDDCTVGKVLRGEPVDWSVNP